MLFVQSLVEFEMRDAVNFQSWERDTWQRHENKQNPYCLQWCQSFIFWDLNCKFGSVAYPGHPYILLIFGDSNWKFCCRLPCGHPNKTWYSDEDISDFGFYYFIFEWKKNNSKPAGYTRTMYLQTGKNTKLIWCLSLIFKVVYQDHFTQLLPFTWDFIEKWQRLIWGQMG